MGFFGGRGKGNEEAVRKPAKREKPTGYRLRRRLKGRNGHVYMSGTPIDISMKGRFYVLSTLGSMETIRIFRYSKFTRYVEGIPDKK